ncbi:MAG TPA: PAS domain S-box protein, partial [Desulfobacteraceae bacterium]|nr:PAS domain S-box protein [Desulfobacteraceae bacterium]
MIINACPDNESMMQKEAKSSHYEYEMLLDIVEFLPDPTFAIDRDKRVIAWNKAMEEMTGVPKKDMMGRADQSYAMDVYREKRPLLIDLVLLKDEDQAAYYEFFERRGDVLYAESYIPSVYNGRGAFLWGKASPLYDKNGKVVGAVETLRDITNQRQTYNALRESEKKYKQLVEEINDIIYMLDGKGVVTYISPPVTSISGYSPGQVIGRYFADFIHKDDRERLMMSFKNLLAGQAWDAAKELRITGVSGETRWMQISSKPVYEKDRVVGLRGVLRDITEKKNAEEELSLSEERYRALVDLSPDAICVTDGSGVFIFVNDAGLDLIAAERHSDIIGKSLFEFLHPDYHIAGEKLLKKLVESKSGFPLTETRLVRVDGKVIDVEMAATPMQYAGETCVQAVVRDVTERKRRDKEIKDSEERYRVLTEHVADGVALLQEGRLIFVNRSFAAVFGFLKPEELTGRHLIDLVDEGQKEEFNRLMKELDAGLRSQYFFQIQCLAVDGRQFWVEGYMNPIQWEESPAVLI